MIERLHLEILEELNKEGSLTKAASKLSLTQPALTHSIQKLENILGCKLWIKEGRTLRLTKNGLFLLKRAKKIIPQFIEMEKTLEALISGKRGNIRICVECHPCYELILGITEEFLIKWKDVELDVTKNFQFNGIEAILNRSIDIIISPDKYEHPSLEYYPIIDFKLILAININHALSEKKYIEPKDLINETVLTYPVDINRLDIFSEFLLPGKVMPKKHKTVEATEIMLQLVSAGRGVSSFPDWLIEKYKMDYNISGISLGDKGIHKTLYIGIRKEDRDVEYLSDFIRMAQKRFK